MAFVYVTMPAALALFALTVSGVVSYLRCPQPLPIRVSVLIGTGQAVFVAFSAWQTFERSISSVACLTSMLGWGAVAVIGALDGFNLLWWLWSRRGQGDWGQPVAFFVLRMMAHALFVLALVWHAALCTV